MEIENEKEITNAPIGAQKVNFQPFLDIMTDRPTNQPSDGQTNRPTVRWTDQGRQKGNNKQRTNFDKEEEKWRANK